MDKKYISNLNKKSPRWLSSQKREIRNWLKTKQISFSENDFRKSFSYLFKNNRPFLTLAVKKLGSPCVIKIFLLPEKDYFKQAILNEARVYQFLPESFNKKSEYYAGLPSLIEKSDSAQPFAYLLREEVFGQTAGKLYHYQKGGLDQKKITKIVHSLKKLSQLSPSLFLFQKQFNVNQEKWGKDIFKFLLKIVPQNLRKEVNLSAISALAKRAFSEKLPPPTLAHGDILPGNIITNKRDVFLIDWEKLFLGSLFYDPASLYAFLWPEPKLQEETLKLILKQYKNEYQKRKLEFWLFIVYHLTINYIKNHQSKILVKKINNALSKV